MQSRINFEFYEGLIDIIAVSEAVQNDLKIALKQAFENPRSFYDEDDEYILEWRGLTFSKDADLTAKFVLIDKMQSAGQMTEVDWKEDEEEVRCWINKILNTKNYSFQISNEYLYEGKDTYTVLKSINDNELKPNGFSLEILDINSDSYVFTIVPLDKQKTVREMFEKLK